MTWQDFPRKQELDPDHDAWLADQDEE